jgi:hypothetical protein
VQGTTPSLCLLVLRGSGMSSAQFKNIGTKLKSVHSTSIKHSIGVKHFKVKKISTIKSFVSEYNIDKHQSEKIYLSETGKFSITLYGINEASENDLFVLNVKKYFGEEEKKFKQ